MSDLIERLRGDGVDEAIVGSAILLADELTALRSQVSELRADLEAAVAILEQARDGEDHYRKARIVSALATLNTIRKDG